MSAQQLGLFDAPHVKGSKTSKAAAESFSEDALNVLQAKVLAFIRTNKGATDEEVQRALGLNPSTQRPRRIELVTRGLVIDSGTKRDTTSGRAAVVWCAK